MANFNTGTRHPDSPRDEGTSFEATASEPLSVTRRQVLRGGLIGVAYALLFPNTPLNILRHWQNTTIKLRDSQTTGLLPDGDKMALWNLFQNLAEAWEMKNDNELNQAGLYEFLDLKTNQQPSYLREYRYTIGLLNKLPNDQRVDPIKFLQIIRNPIPPDNVNEDDFDAFIQWVIAEFVVVILINGGFKKLAPLKNIKGYKGGGWDDLAKLPFREYVP